MSSGKMPETAAPVKKRRSFFSTSLALPNLPAIIPSKPAAVPSRHQVLAALSEPHESTPSSSRPKREVKQKPAAESKVEAIENTVERAGASGSRKRAAARPPSPLNTTTPTAGRSLRQRNTTPKQVTPTTTTTPRASSRSRQAPLPFFKSPSNTLASKHRVSSSIRQGKKADAQTLLFAPPKTKGPPPTKDETAQSINERLSQMMMQSMRATIGGRDEASHRQPVWRDNHTVKRRKVTVKVTAPPPPPPRRVVPQTARQRAKRKAEEERKAREAAEAEIYEDVPMDAEGEPETPKKDKGKGKEKTNGTQSKKYMTSGFYCQDANAKSPFKLVSQVYSRQAAAASTSKRKAGLGRNSLLPNIKRGTTAAPIFPPLPYDHGYEHFFGKEHDFVLPYNIHKEATDGALNDKKKPAPYQKIRANAFPERARLPAERAICKCDPDSGCGENCINRIMSYLCGRECPCGEKCTNRSLVKRPGVETKVKYTGQRGFGLFAMQDIKEGDFVIDYRGEVIALDTFMERLDTEYAGVKNFYALAYDQDEVIDSGLRGNDARFINHGCDPNLEVRKYQTIGDGLEEYEIGMWAIRDIKQGEELFYNYNFDWFAEAQDDLRAQCRCGAANCIGTLGRKGGEKGARDAELTAKKAAVAARALSKGRKSRSTAQKSVSNPRIKVQFSGAAARAKRTMNIRSTNAAARASAPWSAAQRTNDIATEEAMDESRVILGGLGHSEWVDMSISVDEGIALEQESDAGALSGEAIVSVIARSAEALLDPEPEMAGIISDTAPQGHTRKASSASSESSVLPYQPKNRITSPDRLVKSTAKRANQVAISSDIEDRSSSAEEEIDELQDSSSQIFDSQQEGLGGGSDAPSDQLPVAEDNVVAQGTQAANSAAAKRKSGWSNWLRKIAAEKTRTLEEWHEERMKRRRGIAWMNMMIAEYGVAPSPLPANAQTYSDGRKPAGSSGSFANSLAAQGHGPGPEGVRNLGGPGSMYRSDNWKKTKEQQMKYTSRGSAAPESSNSVSPTTQRNHGNVRSNSNTPNIVNPPDSSTVTLNLGTPAQSGITHTAIVGSSSKTLAPYELVDVVASTSTNKPTWKVAASAPTWKVQSTVPGQQGAKVILPPSTFTPPDNSHLQKGSGRGAESKRKSLPSAVTSADAPTTSANNAARSSLPTPRAPRPISGWSPEDAEAPVLNGVVDALSSTSSSTLPISPYMQPDQTAPLTSQAREWLFPTTVSPLEFAPRQTGHGGETPGVDITTPPPPLAPPHPTVSDNAAVLQDHETRSSPVSIERRQSNKRKAIAKRNGAPMGWVYEVVTEATTPTRPEETVQEDLPRAARRARLSLLKEGAA